VMEMCIDNPRTDFTDIFATHPSVDKRVQALVEHAGGHDPGPSTLAQPSVDEGTAEQPAEGPWSDSSGEGKGEAGSDGAFLPSHPPVELGRAAPEGGPWGPRGPWGLRKPRN
jgi:heat shock protein HtpX